jgi:hypothetical protein
LSLQQRTRERNQLARPAEQNVGLVRLGDDGVSYEEQAIGPKSILSGSAAQVSVSVFEPAVTLGSVVPDGVSSVSVVTQDGHTADVEVKDNFALARLPGAPASALPLTVTWLDPAGNVLKRVTVKKQR